jgi:uncharacterized protein YodC (DUF2158 family)
MANFNPGDVVRLRSGGPAMTVQSLANDRETLWCVWFDAKGEHNRQNFGPSSLKADDSED